MSPQEAALGSLEVMLPEGGRVLVEIPDAIADNGDVEADLVRIMLAAEGSDGDVCEAIARYADSAGLTANYFLGRQSMVVAIGLGADGPQI